ncbi:hypothetical protein ALQ95_200125 [Pseudomonas syringae pv. ribicola]|uniref:Secreted protein n=1 Tax=Pseudomonas syringae pv. ribicola TaxID=55398 RepID=A0A3M2VZT5_PSESI|nr:hypothetical protein ALQ95_200125 [Pseudomonas syringae pv. ribicola]
MFPQTRLLFQPPPMLMLSMFPALPMVTALPPPTLYKTSSPMTLPDELALIPGVSARALWTVRALINVIVNMAAARRMIEVLLIIIESPYCQEKFVLAACSRNRVAIAPRRMNRLWLACPGQS